jgi:hypothetical protein
MSRDWTIGAEGRCNTSPVYLGLTRAVAQLIRNDAHTLLRGGAESTAGLILAQLAHVHELSPPLAQTQGYCECVGHVLSASSLTGTPVNHCMRCGEKIACAIEEAEWRTT